MSKPNQKHKQHSDSKKLLDFIYLDKFRLDSLVSQLNSSGITTQEIIQTGSKDLLKKYQKATEGMAVKIGIPTVADASLNQSREQQQEFSEETALNNQQTINTEHLIPLLLVEGLIQSGLALKKLDVEHGRLIYISGTLSLRDTRILQNLYDPMHPFIPEPEEEEYDKTDMIELFKHMPHSISAVFHTKQGNAWATFNPDYLKIDTVDWFLKHGSNIAGQWHCLAILDRKPADNHTATESPDVEISGAIDTMFDSLNHAMEAIVKRPKSSFCITPIALYRELITESLKPLTE